MQEEKKQRKQEDMRSAPKNSEPRWQDVRTPCQAHAHNQSWGLYPACAAVYLFFIRRKDSVFRSNQSQTTWQHGGPAFPYFSTWRSFVHVNDPFIVLLTDVDHRKPAAGLQWAPRLYAWSHVVWREFHPFLPINHQCPWLAIHILVHAYRAAARLRLQHDAGVSRTGYVWTHLICAWAACGKWVAAQTEKASPACNVAYYVSNNSLLVNNKLSLTPSLFFLFSSSLFFINTAVNTVMSCMMCDCTTGDWKPDHKNQTCLFFE